MIQKIKKKKIQKITKKKRKKKNYKKRKDIINHINRKYQKKNLIKNSQIKKQYLPRIIKPWKKIIQIIK